jgi:Bacteriocin-protection, YdeI or OmpD-Associated/Domain of unknown function (DUF1905)
MADDPSRARRFKARVSADPRGRGVIQLPFDPDAAWGAKKEHLVGGKIDGRQVRGSVVPGDGGWVLTLGAMWMRDASVADGAEVVVRIAPEGPLRQDLADDFAAALAANPAAADFYDTLAQFYRRAYLRWIDSTTRRPELRAARITEVIELLAAGVKERPR